MWLSERKAGMKFGNGFGFVRRLFFGTMNTTRILLGIMLMTMMATPAIGAEEKVFRTGRPGFPRYFSVSSSGKFLVFGTEKPLGGLYLLNLMTGAIGSVPAEPGRFWEMPSISGDGTQMVAVSTGMVDGKYNLGDMKIIVVSLKDWSWREVSPGGDGVKIDPFYSQNGDKIYYFKGAIRKDRGATPASKYDLYVINGGGAKDERLTESLFYQVSAGDVSADGSTVYFSRYGGTPMTQQVQRSGDDTNELGLVALDVRSKELRPTQHYHKSKYVFITDPGLDAKGRIYFFGTPRGKGPFEYSVFRDNGPNGGIQRLANASNSSSFSIAKRSGDIYVSDAQNGEVVFRRLAINANE